MARIKFERGDPDNPVGHAFLVFRGAPGADDIAATYLVVPPIPIDFAKYVPPLLASSLGASGLIAQTAFLPVPPAPEPISLRELQRLAEQRGDDVLDSGVSANLDIASLMGHVAEQGDAYAEAYQRRQGKAAAAVTAKVADPEEPPGGPMEGMAVLYSMLTEQERVAELARRVGTLRYAVEGGDRALTDSTAAEMRAIGAYLPDRYRFDELIAAATRRDASGTSLAQLYVERGYRLAGGDYAAVDQIEAEIARLLDAADER